MALDENFDKGKDPDVVGFDTPFRRAGFVDIPEGGRVYPYFFIDEASKFDFTEKKLSELIENMPKPTWTIPDFKQEYPTKPPKAKITFEYGSMKGHIDLNDSDLLPKNSFKLGQKVSAMIKEAMKNKK